MITGAIIALLSLLVGFCLGRFVLLDKGVGPQSLPSGVGKCGCDHNKAFHNPKTGECHGAMKNPAFSSDYYVSKSNPRMIQCSCKQYAPEGIEEIYNTLANAPSLLPPPKDYDG